MTLPIQPYIFISQLNGMSGRHVLKVVGLGNKNVQDFKLNQRQTKDRKRPKSINIDPAILENVVSFRSVRN